MKKLIIIILLFPFIVSHSQNLDLSKVKSPFGGKTKKQLIVKQKTIDSLNIINRSLGSIKFTAREVGHDNSYSILLAGDNDYLSAGDDSAFSFSGGTQSMIW